MPLSTFKKVEIPENRLVKFPITIIGFGGDKRESALMIRNFEATRMASTALDAQIRGSALKLPPVLEGNMGQKGHCECLRKAIQRP